MPFTFLAHQGPFLPLARRWPRALDGVTLVIGTMAPDMAYVLADSRFRVEAHGMPELVLFCVPVTLVVSWIVVHLLAPVVPDHLPSGGQFRLREFRGLALHRFRPVPSLAGALAGALSHVVLDSFTHDWGWLARNVSWYDDPITDTNWFGRQWTVFRTIQYTGHVVGSALCVWLLWRYGKQRWMSASADRVGPVAPSLRSHLTLWGATAIGAAAGLVWIEVGSAGFASDVLRVSACTFAALCVGAWAVGRRAGWDTRNDPSITNRLPRHAASTSLPADTGTRKPSAVEIAVLQRILSEVPDSEDLRRQLADLLVRRSCDCGCPSIALVHLDESAVPTPSTTASPLAVYVRILPEDDEPPGEMIVFVTADGRLADLEVYWYGDSARAMPAPDRLDVRSLAD